MAEVIGAHAAQDVSLHQDLKDEIASVHEDVAVIKTLLQYHFQMPKKAK